MHSFGNLCALSLTAPLSLILRRSLLQHLLRPPSTQFLAFFPNCTQIPYYGMSMKDIVKRVGRDGATPLIPQDAPEKSCPFLRAPLRPDATLFACSFVCPSVNSSPLWSAQVSKVASGYVGRKPRAKALCNRGEAASSQPGFGVEAGGSVL